VSAQPDAACGHCGGRLAERQRWCLACGSAALTRIGSARRWAGAGAAAAIVAVLALVGIGFAVAALVSS